MNKPVLSTGMTPIKWDASNNEMVTTVNDPEWYDYNSKKWANVKTQDESYWVWIPRYAYKITSGYHSSETGSIDVVFLKDTTTENGSDIVIETTGYNTETKNTGQHYFLHPAFQFDGEELGFWVAKFEPTASEGVATITGTCNTADNVTTKTIKIVPNVTSWRCINISNAFTVSMNMKDNGSVYGWNTSEVDTHMMKNIEWGAIAYLSKSVYGAHTEEIWNNSFNQYRTGCSGSVKDAANESTCVEYNTTNGAKASTTHNITGIYDISGGSWENVASYVNNGNSNLITNGNSLVNEPDNKYKNIHVVGSPDEETNNYEANKNVYGDAVYEISNNIGGSHSWDNNYSYMQNTTWPFFTRGGHSTDGTGAGIFSFGGAIGDAHAINSFRPVVFLK